MQSIKKKNLISLLEHVNPKDVNLSSFIIQPELNPKVWLTEDLLYPEIREQLISIANDFFKFLDIDWVKIKDIHFTGSLANYNWSEFSDIDLHLLISYEDVNEDVELVKDYLKAKKDLWGKEHNLKIRGYDVELYAQDENEKHASTGVYSIQDEKWILKPTQEKPEIDKLTIKKKSSELMNKIDEIVSDYKKEKYQDVLDAYEILWKKIKKMRQSGLDKSGEFSSENLIFKVLRRTNYIEKLTTVRLKAYDKLNSIDESEMLGEAIINKIRENEKRFVVTKDKFKLFLGKILIADSGFGIEEPDQFFNEKYVTLFNVKTVKEYQGKGFAKELLENIFNYVKNELNINIITLQVYKNNTKAVNLYNKSGFQIYQDYDSSYILIKKL